MQREDTLCITLTPDLTRRIRAKLAAGHYQTELEVLEEGLDALDPFDDDLDRWIFEEVVPAYDAIQSNPSRGLSVQEVQAALATLHDQAIRAG